MIEPIPGAKKVDFIDPKNPPMDDKTLEALKASIKHWEEIVEEITECLGQFFHSGVFYDVHLGNEEESNDPLLLFNYGTDSCELCKIFTIDDLGCRGCPVSHSSGHPSCTNTPWQAFSRSMMTERFDQDHADNATDELNFLKSLLPVEQNETT